MALSIPVLVGFDPVRCYFNAILGGGAPALAAHCASIGFDPFGGLLIAVRLHRPGHKSLADTERPHNFAVATAAYTKPALV